ncbi:MAG: hypothetical protein HZA83_02505, partial [Thaumarchaeota archaeon]|nr:hypothetical protein [Nitrososphaerota archaeon]
MQTTKSGQTSVEFLVILSVTLVILISVIILSQQQISTVVQTKSISDAKNTVDDLAGAAKDVYAQGTGAKKQVFVKIPGGYNYTDSSVGNMSIKMRVGGTDYISTLSFDVHGSLPRNAGGQWVWVISEGNRVRIGAAMLEVSKSAISIMTNRNASASDSFYVKNIWNNSINVTITNIWAHDNVSMTVLPQTFSLNVQDQQLEVVYFATTSSAVGFYTGTIKIEGTDGTTNETVLLPVTIEIATSAQAPPLVILQSTWNEIVVRNSTVTKEFELCTNDVTSLTRI